MRSLLMGITVSLLLATGAGTAAAQSGYDLFQQALVKERADGNLQQAIQLYQRIVLEYAADRALASRALLQMGRSYERLGSTEAGKAYERLLRDYADQREQVATARARLAVLSRVARAAQPEGMAIRRIWTYPESRLDAAGQVSADGRYLPVEDMATGDLMIRDLATGENRYLTHNAVPRAHDVGDAQVSPDTRWVAYNWDNNEDQTTDLRITRLDGSGTRVLYSHEEVRDIVAEGWSPDGANVLVQLVRKDRTRQIAWISVADGSVRVLKTLGWQGYPRMRLSPDGRYIAYDFAPLGSDSTHGIRLLAADGSRETPLVEHPGDDHVLGWAPDGKSLLFRSERSGTEDGWVIQIDDGKPQGPPQLVKKNIGRLNPRGMTRDGAFYYTVSVNTRGAYVATLDPGTGNLLAPPRPASHRYVGNTLSPDWSPTGEYLAYYVSNRSGSRIFVIRSVETGEERDLPRAGKFVAGRGQSAHMRWSPDGRSILLVGWDGADDGSRRGVYQLDVETGDVTPIVQSVRGVYVGQAVWSPDGKVIFYTRRNTATQSAEIVVRELETGQETKLHDAAAPRIGGPGLAISPDGQYLAFLSSWGPLGTGAKALSVIPTAGGEPRELLRVQAPERINGNVVAWTPDGRYVVFGKQTQTEEDAQGSTTKFWRVPAAGGEPQMLGLAIEDPLDLRFHPDGRRITFTSRVDIDEIWVMENFLPPTEGGNE